MSTDSGILDLTGLRTESTPEHPYTGRVADSASLWVDIDDLSAPGLWNSHDADHILVPLAVARTHEGHVARLTRCRAPLLAALPDTLSAGEAVTALVSILRGAIESHRRDLTPDSWWLTFDGRPIARVAGPDPSSASLGATSRVVQEIGSRSPEHLRDLAHEVETFLTQLPPRTSEQENLEARLFNVASPAPLRLRTARQNAQTQEASEPSRRAPRNSQATGHSPAGLNPAGLRSLAGALIDRGIVERACASAHASLARLRRTTSRERGSRRQKDRPRNLALATPADVEDRVTARVSRMPRRAPVLLGAGVCALVLGIGLLWPDAESSVAADATGVPPQKGAPSASAVAPRPAASANDDEPPTGDTAPQETDAEDELVALVARFSACAEEQVCAVREGGARAFPTGVATTPLLADAVSIVDDYGGVAVARVTGDGQSQMIVIVREKDQWLVRDVYDVADQP